MARPWRPWPGHAGCCQDAEAVARPQRLWPGRRGCRRGYCCPAAAAHIFSRRNIPPGGTPPPRGIHVAHAGILIPCFAPQPCPLLPHYPACRPDWSAGRTGLRAGLACKPDWPAVQTGLQSGLNTPASYLHPITKQKSNYVTKIQLRHKNPITQQKPNYVTFFINRISNTNIEFPI